MKRKNHGRQAPIPASANKVAKTVIAGTIGLSLLQVPIWAGASLSIRLGVGHGDRQRGQGR